MSNHDDEEEKAKVDREDEQAEVPENDRAHDKTEENPHEPSGELGEQEQVMGDNESPKPAGKFKRFFSSYWRKKKWTLPLTLLLLVGIVLALPATRYPVFAASGMKRRFVIEVWDSKTNTPVSGAKVTLDGQTRTTNRVGGVVFTIKVGGGTLSVSKQYYQPFSEKVFVGVTHKSTNARFAHIVATGRQVPVTVVNNITGKPITNAEIKVLDTSSKTDSTGKAIIVLPTGSDTLNASISAGGYNDLSGKVQVTSDVVNANTFKLTPAGHVYFLSNLSGNIDVVSTNLDGSDRQTVLAGTGKEDLNDTALLATRDWKFLALQSKRDGGQHAKLFLVNTANNNQLTTMDEGDADFTPVGWLGHDFIYKVDRDNVKAWQSGGEALKSYNADTGKITVLDQTTASGSDWDYINQDFGYFSISLTNDNKVVYIKQWSSVGPASLSGKQNQILSISPDGTDKQILKGFTVSNDSFQNIYPLVVSPGTIDFQVSNGSGTVYYVYANNTVTQSNTINDDSFQQAQQSNATYLQSPSGSQTFWAAQRDGKNTLFVGDGNGDNGMQIANLSDYTTYGWYTDNYLLAEKSGNELYVMSPAAGAKALKISDYYKPPRNFYGYGGGYGGL